MEDIATVIGRNIKRKRIEHGLSLATLSRKLDDSRPKVIVWENGEHAPSAYYLYRLSQIFECPIDELFQVEVHENGQAVCSA